MEQIKSPDALLYPALSIPLHRKDEFSCPQDHITAMEGILPKVTKMITIGWRGAEEEFLRRLKFARKMPAAGIKRAIRLLVITASLEGVKQAGYNIRTNGDITPDLFVEFEQKQLIKGFSGLLDNWPTLRTFLQMGDAGLA